MKQSGVPLEHYRLHQDNSPPLTAVSTLLGLDVLGFGRVDHLPNSPYLAPFDFDVYPKVKSQVKGPLILIPSRIMLSYSKHHLTI